MSSGGCELYCSECGAEIPDGGRVCPSCGAKATGSSGGSNEIVAIILSLVLPGTGLIYLGEVKRGFLVFLPSIVLMVLVLAIYGYSGEGSFGIHVDSLPGFVMLFAMFVLWVYGNVATRAAWKRKVGLHRAHTFISDSRIRTIYRDIGRVRNYEELQD